jgi:hypothetical protein
MPTIEDVANPGNLQAAEGDSPAQERGLAIARIGLALRLHELMSEAQRVMSAIASLDAQLKDSRPAHPNAAAGQG